VDISLVKGEKLLGTAEFERRDRVSVKRVEVSMNVANGSLKAKIIEGKMSIVYRLQLVSKQVDLNVYGTLGRDFLKEMQSRICYREQVLIFQQKGIFIHKKLTSLLVA
jgi:hypothetical protein